MTKRPGICIGLVGIFSSLPVGCVKENVSVPHDAGEKRIYTAENVHFTMVYVPAERFFTGVDDDGQATVEKPFWIMETEVTYRHWKTVWDWAVDKGGYSFSIGGLKGSDGTGDETQPVTTINWTDAAVWCNALTEWVNAQTGAGLSCAYVKNGVPFRDFTRGQAGEALKLTTVPDGVSGFRLPWSREWELAARYKADVNNDGDIMDPGEYYPGNYVSGAAAPYTDEAASLKVAVLNRGRTAPVKSLLPNALGLYDMGGNVEEWCFDHSPLKWSLARDTKGGNWLYGPDDARIGLTVPHDTYNEYFLGGFRAVRSE
jgi:sulfatase modifying factor 1